MTVVSRDGVVCEQNKSRDYTQNKRKECGGIYDEISRGHGETPDKGLLIADF